MIVPRPNSSISCNPPDCHRSTQSIRAGTYCTSSPLHEAKRRQINIKHMTNLFPATFLKFLIQFCSLCIDNVPHIHRRASCLVHRTHISRICHRHSLWHIHYIWVPKIPLCTHRHRQSVCTDRPSPIGCNRTEHTVYSPPATHQTDDSNSVCIFRNWFRL